MSGYDKASIWARALKPQILQGNLEFVERGAIGKGPRLVGELTRHRISGIVDRYATYRAHIRVRFHQLPSACREVGDKKTVARHVYTNASCVYVLTGHEVEAFDAIDDPFSGLHTLRLRLLKSQKAEAEGQGDRTDLF
jgi:hypothetical protein